MPNRGSGRVLFSTKAATTVVGTVTSCHPLGENCRLEMTSPLASTLAEVCRDQPSRRASFESGERLEWGGFWARRDETKKIGARTKKTVASRLPVFIMLL